jgi:hypothetical protein
MRCVRWLFGTSRLMHQHVRSRRKVTKGHRRVIIVFDPKEACAKILLRKMTIDPIPPKVNS